MPQLKRYAFEFAYFIAFFNMLREKRVFHAQP